MHRKHFIRCAAGSEAIADWLNGFPEINHNYEREHAYSLWFVITGPSREWIEQRLHVGGTGLEGLRARVQLGREDGHRVSCRRRLVG